MTRWEKYKVGSDFAIIFGSLKREEIWKPQIELRKI